MDPAAIDRWFSPKLQRDYISRLSRRVGLTRRRAECFVRLWTYLLLKQQYELGNPLKHPLTELHLPDGLVACTHREAAELFYTNTERGSDRSAGMMLDKLRDLGLIEKQFDGNHVFIQIQPLPHLTSPPTVESVQFEADNFNPQTDAIPVASFLARNYNWMNTTSTAVPQKIYRLLRDWVKYYPTGMRVLRRCDTNRPVGFYLLYPTTKASEENFFLPPTRSLHFSSGSDVDPFTMAEVGDLECHALFVRSWKIDIAYKNRDTVCQFLHDTQKTIVKIQVDFPNCCDLYAMSIHPSDEELAMALGFQKIATDPKSSLYWMYTAIDQFLALDIAQALSTLEFATPPAAEV